MRLRFKIGTMPAVTHIVQDYPLVGDRIELPYPTGGIYTVKITSIDFALKLEDSLFRGEWI